MARVGGHLGKHAALGAAALLLVATGCGSRRDFGADPAAVPVAPVPLVAAPVTIAPAPAVTVLSGEDVSASSIDAAPVDVGPPPADIGVLGRIVIPRLGVDASLLEGDELAVLDFGPGHRIGSALPGEVGNVVVAGHRTTHSRPFRDLDQLQPGDDLFFETSTGTYQYQFVVHDVVSPSEGEITDQPYGYVATLYACHPPGSARTRLVAYFRLVSAPAPGEPDPTTVPVVALPFT